MVFSNHSNAAYLPLDSDQGVTFYKNENLLFAPPPPVGAASPATLVCRRNTPVAAMLSTSTGSSPFSGQPLLHGPRQNHGNNVCDDFQPVAHLSSNGYYGYVPPVNAMPTKVMSTEQAGTPPVVAPTHVNGNGVGILLDSIHPVTAATDGGDSYSMMMDCGGGGGGIGQVENYHQQQQQQLQHLRKRKEYSDEVEGNCKRRKTWMEQPHDAGFVQSPHWSQPLSNQMDCQDQAMDTFSPQQQFPQQSPITMNSPTTIAFNGFQHQHHHLGQQLPQQQSTLISTPPMPATPSQQNTILQQKSKYPETSRCMMSHMI